MNLAIAGDHAGFEYKSYIIRELTNLGHKLHDYGTDSLESCDYPDYVHPAARSLENGVNEMAILICGSANGVCMTANKHQGVRAAICWNVELAELARQHNDANAVCIPARFIDKELALEIVRVFISTKFEGGRHERRVNKIAIK